MFYHSNRVYHVITSVLLNILILCCHLLLSRLNETSWFQHVPTRCSKSMHVTQACARSWTFKIVIIASDSSSSSESEFLSVSWEKHCNCQRQRLKLKNLYSLLKISFSFLKCYQWFDWMSKFQSNSDNFPIETTFSIDSDSCKVS